MRIMILIDMEEFCRAKKVLEAIQQADDVEINEMLQAIICRNDMLFPENEMICVNLPKKDHNERRHILEWVTRQLLEEKENLRNE